MHWMLIGFTVCLWIAGEARPDDGRRTPKVLILGIDGCRPDALAVAKTPHLDALTARGTWFENTDIVNPEAVDAADTVSGPGWSNLLTGVWPNKHGVIDNKFTAPRYERYPHLFVRIKEVRPQAVCASFSTWKPIAEKIVSSADVNENFSDEPTDYARWDAEATAACCRYLGNSNPEVVILYQGQVDEAGHAHGFHPRVEQYVAALQAVDGHVGEVLAAIENRESRQSEDWLVLVCTDHGGVGLRHGGGRNEPEVRQTFLIVSGEAARRGRSDEPTYQVDMVATALAHLHITRRKAWELDGRPVGLIQRESVPNATGQ